MAFTARASLWQGTWATPYLALAACAAPACLSPKWRKTSCSTGLPAARPGGLASDNLTLAPLREACPFPKGAGSLGDRLRLKTGFVTAPHASKESLLFSLDC